MEDLGWENGWYGVLRMKNEAIVKKCRDLGHRREDIDVGAPRRGLEHVVKCLDGCGWVYRYDSGD